jgi:S-DNA-T family DNA segregation ATPase FtsK/SpoIIIE
MSALQAFRHVRTELDRLRPVLGRTAADLHGDGDRGGWRWSVMGAHAIGVVILACGALGVAVWVLAKLGHLLAKVAEAVAAAAVLFLALWLAVKAVMWSLRQAVTHWRTTLTVLAVTAWCHWLGWVSLVVLVGAVAVSLAWWRLTDLGSFDRWAGRYLRAWRLRWMLYARKLPGWLHACGLSVRDDTVPVVVTVNLVGRKKIRRDQQSASVRLPVVLGVKSGPSWDEVRVRLVLGQKPEDYDEAARALASARQVARCQVREIKPNVVSIDFQRRNLLADAVACRPLVGAPGADVDVRRVWSGRTEYRQDWHVSLAGGHTLVAGSTGAGKNSVMWCPWCPSLRLSGTVWFGCPGSIPRGWNWPTVGGSSLAMP